MGITVGIAPALQQDAVLSHCARRVWYAPIAQQAGRVRGAAGAVPPGGLLFVSMLASPLGAAIAKNLFHTLGPGGTVFLRIGFAALVLFAVERPRWQGYRRADYAAAALFGLAIAGMNTAFYAAIARIPLGIAVALEFIGPLAIAVVGSRRRLDLLWATLAAAGVILLAPTGRISLDPLGIAFGLLTAACLVAYILLNVRVGRVFQGHAGLVLAMTVAALAVLPFGVREDGLLLNNPQLLLAGVGVALLSSVIPFSMEHAALKRLPARLFGVLMSAEPAVAAVVGVVVLGDTLGARSLLAIACVVSATAGSTLFRRHNAGS